MINRIIRFSIKNKFAVGIFALALILYGVYSLTQLPIDAVPDITNNQVQIYTLSPSLAAQEVEQFITAPIERSLASLPDLVEIRSISRFGLSVITVVFKDNVDIYFGRTLVDQRIKETSEEIPEEMGKPEMGPVTTGLGEVYQYVLHVKEGFEDKYTAMQLREMQDWIVARQLIGIPGVAEVVSFGGYLKQYEVAVDPQRLRSMDVSIPDLFTALEKNNQNTGGAFIEKSSSAYYIRGVGLVKTLEDIGKIVVKSGVRGTPVLIRDIATVQLGSANRYGAMTRNGKGEVSGGVVMMLKGQNSAKVVESIKERIPVIQKSLPEGVVIESFLDRSSLIDRAINTVRTNLIEGALIVIFILVLFLGNFRAGFIVASVIPLSMLFAIIMMNIFGVSGNLMSLGAIDFGLIVDGAVIVVEAVLFKIIHSNSFPSELTELNNEQMDEAVYQSASQMMNSATFGQIIILIVYIPILTLVGIEGKMFKPMAMTVSFAIIGAVILSLTYVPMMSALFLSRKTVHKKNISDKLMDFFQKLYKPAIEFAIRNKYLVTLSATVLFAGSVFLFTKLGAEFLPTLEEGDFAFHSMLPEGATVSMSAKNNEQVEKILMSFPEVKEVVSKTGTTEIPTDPMAPYDTDVMIILEDKDKWTTTKDYNALKDSLVNELSKTIPGVAFEAIQPIEMRFNELMTGVRQDVAVKIFGENIDSLAAYADKVASVIRKIEGAEGVTVERTTGMPQVSILYDRNRIAQYGLNINDLNSIVRTAFAGETAGQVYEDERKFDVVVRLIQQDRKDIEDVRNLFVPLPSGEQIPLQQVADIKYTTGPNQISREDAKRRIVIGFNVSGRDVKSVVDELKQNLDQKIKLPSGYYFTYGGSFKNLEEATNRLLIALPVALILILVLLYFTFGSFKEALIIYTAIPLSAIGGIVALWLRDMPFSISAGVGFIALFGVAVLNGIVLISTFNQLEKDGVSDIVERVRKGTKMRLRPVLMTASVASLGFLPMAISTSAGAEVQKPLATVVIGGLISATALTLLVLPSVYIIFSGRKKHIKPGMVHSIIIFAFIILLSGKITNAQTADVPVYSADGRSLTIDSAIAIALKNNPRLQSSQLEITQKLKLKKSAFDLGKTGFFYENEDLIKGSNDKGVLKIGITQEIEFPTKYFAQGNVNQRSIDIAKSRYELSKAEIIHDVRKAYYRLWFEKEKLKLLRTLDSIYIELVKFSEVRYSSGETNYLETISAKAKQKEILLSYDQAASDISIARQDLMNVLYTNEKIDPPDLPLQKMNLTDADTSSMYSHPFLNISKGKILLAESEHSLEKQKLLPDFSIRYFNENWFGNEGYYGYSFGISLPLFFWAQQGRIQSAYVQQNIAKRNFDSDLSLLTSEYKKAKEELNKNKLLLEYYDSVGVAQSDEILKSASIAFGAGEISYIEYISHITQSLEIKKSYLETVNNYNQSIIDIKYYLNK